MDITTQNLLEVDKTLDVSKAVKNSVFIDLLIIYQIRSLERVIQLPE